MMKQAIRRIAASLARRDMIRKAVAEADDIRVYTNRPTPRVMLGIFFMLFSYVLGWPLIGVLGWLAFHTGQSLIVLIGGPAAYGVSNLVFYAGAYLAGKPYAKALLKWLLRVFLEKSLGPEQVRVKDAGEPEK